MINTFSVQGSPLANLFGRLQALFAQPAIAQLPQIDTAAFMQASVAAAVHIIVADGEAAEAEFDAAAEGIRSHVDPDASFDPGELTDMLHATAIRARTRSGRIENLRQVSALAGRPMSERQAVFLLAADVADVEGTSGIEERALAEVAAALDVNRTALSDQRAGL